MKVRSAGRDAVVAAARAWRIARDRKRMSGFDCAMELGMMPTRFDAILSAKTTPTDAEAAALDALLGVES